MITAENIFLATMVACITYAAVRSYDALEEMRKVNAGRRRWAKLMRVVEDARREIDAR